MAFGALRGVRGHQGVIRGCRDVRGVLESWQEV